ncbi:MAG: tRNA adenosine(34) deaminase TadA [Candidatus Omnitrophica bacterium]|nr:tRNA adenosine(34) deaminase TadA [Candidatus Omnitrophota bacterium]
MESKNDIFFMREALKQARLAFSLDEVPVGAVVVHKDKIIARAHNQVEMLKDPTAHAEMLVLTQACNFLGNKWLLDCALYVTIEPCSMCSGALVLSRIKKIIYGAKDPKTGACGSVINIANNKKLNHHIQVKRGILEKDCSLLLKEFFRKKRKESASKN